MLNINLLDNQRKQLVKRQEQAVRLNRIAYLVLTGVVVTSAIVFGLTWQFNSWLAETKKELISRERRLKELDNVKEDSILLAQKLDVIGSILQGRSVLHRKLELIAQLYANEYIQLREVGFGDSTNRRRLEINGGSASAATFVDYMGNIDLYHTDFSLDRIELESLSREENGGYRFSYVMDFSPMDSDSTQKK